MKRILMILLPVLVVAAGAAAAVAMFLARPAAATRIPEPVVPLVRVMPVELGEQRIVVTSQGTVNPRTESTLVPEVAGRVIRVTPAFEAGAFFSRGELLLQVDPHDYRQSLVQSRAEVAAAELRVAQQEAEADVARREWQEIGTGEASPLTLRQPQIAEARAARDAAVARQEMAQRNLQRTEIRAPYDGRVRHKHVDLGRYVTPGTPLATIYAVDFAEVRLPLPDEDLEFLVLPVDYRGERSRGAGPRVILTADFAGREHTWEGEIIRTEGEIDLRSRMVHAVARVKDPYGRGSDPQRPPLAAGMFVQAEILGERIENAARVPRSAMRDDGRLLVVDEEDRLRFRQVEVVRRSGDSVIVRGGLRAGERICLSPLSVVTDGMQVRTGDPS